MTTDNRESEAAKQLARENANAHKAYKAYNTGQLPPAGEQSGSELRTWLSGFLLGRDDLADKIMEKFDTDITQQLTKATDETWEEAYQQGYNDAKNGN